jgi:LemA protein
MPLLILLLIFVFFVFSWIFYAYNRLTQLRNAMETEWADVDVRLKKRADLIPNLVEVVRGYAKHERETLEGVAIARAKALEAGRERSKEESNLSSFVASILALKEQYPDLKANPSFLDLQNRLFEVEGEIAETRHHYNDLVKAYNDFVLKFPASFVAASIGFAPSELFEFTGSREVQEVSFDGTETSGVHLL